MDIENNELLELALTDQELAQLRIKIAKSHRTQKDWSFIRKLLQDKIVFTAEPVNEEYRKEFSLEGILFDGNYLLLFSSIDACREYLEHYGSAKYGYQLTLGCIPFSKAIMAATDRQRKLLFDMNVPQSGNVLGYDGKERTLRIVKTK